MEQKTAQLIRKLLIGKAKDVEVSELDHWFRKNTNDTITTPYSPSWSVTKKRMWKAIIRQIQIDNTKGGRKLRILHWVVAASFWVGVSLGFYFYLNTNRITQNTNAPYIIVGSNVSTTTGEIKKILLPDSSLVWLNAESTIRYPKKFNKKQRLVELTGEAFFNVVRDTSCPFLVYSHNSFTKVLGTSFSVRAYVNETEQVAVVSGKVEVIVSALDQTKGYQLLPGDKVNFNPISRHLEKSHVSDPEQFMAWRTNKLYFDAQPLSEVTATLERKFGVKLLIENEALANRKFRGNFENSDLMEILRTISLSMGIQLEQHKKENTIILILKEPYP